MKRTLGFSALCFLTASTSNADINDWLAEVAAGTAARYSDGAPTTNSNVDIGVYAGTTAATYEIIVNASNYNGGAGPALTGSSALIGVRNTFVGDQSGAKFEQWFDTASYGVTAFGVADYFGSPNTESADLHLVIVCDLAADASVLYENGVLVDTFAHGFALEGVIGIGQVHDPSGGDADQLSGTIHGVAVYDSALPASEIISHRDAFFSGGLGTNYCTGMAVANSTGATGKISASGSTAVADQDFTLAASELPNTSFGFFLSSLTSSFVANPGGSQGNLCLGGAIGRFVGPGQIQNTGQAGEFSLTVDLMQMPTPTGFVSVSPNETWYFQAWHRDSVGGQATSNFTDGLEVDFL